MGLLFVILLCEFGGVTRAIRRGFFFFMAVVNVGLEEVGDVADVLGFEFLFVEGGIESKGRVEEVLGAVVVVHADVFEFEVDFDEIVGEV
jgi:hypothetical protein